MSEQIEKQESASDYAYVPDPEQRSTWKLPIDTEERVSAAIQALSPAGFRGQRVEIPASDRPGVIRRIRAKINSLNIADEAKQRYLDRLSRVKGMDTETKNGDGYDAEMAKLMQSAVGYVTLSSEDGEACANCIWYAAHKAQCQIVKTYPLPILPTGYCERWEKEDIEAQGFEMMERQVSEELADGGVVENVEFTDTGPPYQVVPKDNILTNSSVLDSIRQFLGGKPNISGFKAIEGTNLWVAWYSNNAKDREEEVLSAKGFDRYVKRLELGVIPYPELWYFHIEGTKHGKAFWLDRIGHYGVAVGTFDDTELAQAMRKHYEKAQEAVSHGFVSDPDTQRKKIDGVQVWLDWNTFEISPLPRKFAANSFTDFERIEKMNDTQRAALEKALTPHMGERGKEFVEQLATETAQKNKALEQANRVFKDFVDVEEATTETPEEQADTEAVNLFGEFMSEITGNMATAFERLETLGREVQALKPESSQIAEDLAEIKAFLKQTPRKASIADETVTELTPEQKDRKVPEDGEDMSVFNFPG